MVVALLIAIMLHEGIFLLDGERLTYLLEYMPLLVGMSVLTSLLLGSYRSVWRYMGTADIVNVAQFTLFALMLFYLGQFFVDRLQGLPRSVPLIHFLCAVFLLLAGRISCVGYLSWTEAVPAVATAKPILLVGSGDGAALLIRMHGFSRHPEFEPVGILCDQITTNRSIAGIPVLGDLADFDRVVANLRVQGIAPAQVVITRPHHELGRWPVEGYAAAETLLDRADAAGIEVTDLPDLMRFKGDPASTTPLDRDILTADVYPGIKRALDVVVSFFVLAFCTPLIVMAAATVAGFIQRPVMFIQRRPGRGRKPFKLYKFRTMRDPVDRHGRLLTDSERTPWAGRLLRRTRLDELPQFWNVLIGDMAIIGPRPLLRSDLDAMPDRGEVRCRTKPGITGWAQVNGGHQLNPDEKQALDLWYTRHASFGLDLYIVWRTARMMLLGERRDEDAIATASDEATPSLGVAAE